MCGGRGVIVTELAFMDPIVTECEACGGARYNQEALACTYKGKNIVYRVRKVRKYILPLFPEEKPHKTIWPVALRAEP